MAISPKETLKLSEEEGRRVKELERFFDTKLNDFDPNNPEDIYVSLAGQDWFLQGKSLSTSEEAEIRRRYNKAGWNLEFGYDRTCQYIKFSSKEFPTPQPNW